MKESCSEALNNKYGCKEEFAKNCYIAKENSSHILVLKIQIEKLHGNIQNGISMK